MANRKHVKLLLESVEKWNEWRESSEDWPDLRGANLRAANLINANLNETNLRAANLRAANLSNANLFNANLRNADLSNANLSNTDLTNADLSYASLSYTNLSDANLSNANLSSADLWGSKLWTTDLTRAHLKYTAVSSVDLSQAISLEGVDHGGPSSIGHDTFRMTAESLSKAPTKQGAVEIFLRGAGVEEGMLEYFRTMIGSPIEFYSCFISYSHEDKAFARRMYDGLQGKGIRCWLDEHQLLPGDDIYQSVDRGIRLWDKVLLCCSKASLTSWWVENEIDAAFEKERKLRAEREGQPVLAVIPLNLDDTLFVWQDGRATKLKSRLAADFTGWESDNAKFEEKFEQVVEALQTKGREEPPPPRIWDA